MRVLTQEEVSVISGAGRSSCYDPCRPDPCDRSRKRKQGNNGYGNGGNDGVPGNSNHQDRTR